MINLKALLEKRAAMVSQLESMITAAEAEDRDFNAEEKAKYDELSGKLAALDARIDRARALQERADDGDSPATRGHAAVDDEDEDEDEDKARKSKKARKAEDDEDDEDKKTKAALRRHGGGPAARKSFESFGEFAATVARNPNDQRLVYIQRQAAEQRMDDGPRGGFMVPTEFRAELFQVEPGQALVRPRARVLPAGSPPDAAITFPALDQTGDAPNNVFGGVTVKWIGEGKQKPKTDFKLRQITLQPQEVAATLDVTDKLLRNWQAAGAMVTDLFRGAIRQAEDFAFISGDGIGKPKGFLTSPARLEVARQTANQITYRDLFNMLSKLLMRGGSPVWTATQSLIPLLAVIKDDEGRFVFVQSVTSGMPSTLLGYPIVWNEHTPLAGQKGDLTLTNLDYYLIKDGSGPFIASSEHVRFEENMTVFKTFWNVDAQSWLTEPFKLANGHTVSPFVILK